MAESPRTVGELVADAKQQIENLTIEEASAEIENNDEVLLVDIRERGEQYRLGTIPGAMYAPRGMIEFWACSTSPYYKGEFEPNRRTILFCAAGSRSALATVALQELGFTNVAHIEGGYTAWKDAGLPTETLER